MPNYYQNVMIFHGHCEHEFDAEQFAKDHLKTNWCEVVEPVYGPNPNATCEEQEAAWGVKWGTSKTQAFKLDGDADPVIVAFLTPWRAPSADILNRIGKHLCRLYGFVGFSAVGVDPYDYSFGINVIGGSDG